MSTANNTEQATASVDARWPHRRVVILSSVPVERVLRVVYQALTGTALPETSSRLVIRSEPRGFMIGMGETLSYRLMVGDVTCVDAEDWWEDNISDPETTEFVIQARTAEALEQAVAALTAAAG
ncbi:MAG: hypothetical protein ABI867_23215 [Kofleriaceae bacterium]